MVQKWIFTIIIFPFFLFLSLPKGWSQDTTTVWEYLEKAQRVTTYEEQYTQFEKAYTLAKQLRYNKGIQATLAFMGTIELGRGAVPKALRYLLEEMDVLVQMDTSNRLVSVSTTIGDIYAEEKLYEEALPYYKRALTFKPSDALNQKLGNSYAELLKPDTAFYY